jgi:AsmA protein
MAAAGAKLTVEGSLADPLQGRGYMLKVVANVPDLAALSVYAPGMALPPLHDVAVTAQLADKGAPLPEVSGLTVHVGASDLTATVAGLKLAKLDVAAARLDQPVKASAEGSFANAPLTLAATLGAPGLLMPGAKPAGPFPVDVSVQAAGASLALKGTMANPDRLSGLDLAVTANVADLAALSPLAHRPLPALKTIAFQGALRDAEGGLTKGVALRGMKLTMPEGDVAGDLTVAIAARPSLQGNLKSERIDADALRAAMGKPLPAPAAPAPAAGSPPPAAPAPAAAPSGSGGRVFPDTPIPFSALNFGNADVTLAVAGLKSGGALYRAIAFHLVLADGKLRLDPFAAELPEGHLDGALTADATQPAPPVMLRLHAPALALQPLLLALGEPAYATGNLEVYADLHGAGATPHAIAGSLDGSLGLAMVNGTIDNRLLGNTLGAILREASMLDLVGRGGSGQVQCFAARLDAAHGVGAFRTLVLSSSLLTMDGGGSINLGAETVDLNIRPQGRVGGNGIVVPLRVTGSMRAPSAVADPAAAVAANAGAVAGVAGGLLGSTTPLGALAGALGGQKLGGGRPTGVDCGPALAIARGSAGGAAPARAAAQPAPAAQPAAPQPQQQQQKLPNSGALLKQLLR